MRWLKQEQDPGFGLFFFFTLLCESSGLDDVSHWQQELLCENLPSTSHGYIWCRFFLLFSPLFLANAITEASVEKHWRKIWTFPVSHDDSNLTYSDSECRNNTEDGHFKRKIPRRRAWQVSQRGLCFRNKNTQNKSAEESVTGEMGLGFKGGCGRSGLFLIVGFLRFIHVRRHIFGFLAEGNWIYMIFFKRPAPENGQYRVTWNSKWFFSSLVVSVSLSEQQ